MKQSVYIETSILSYLTARPSRDVRAAAWQQITWQWWEEARLHYELFTSELTIVEISAGNPEAAQRRAEAAQDIPRLAIDAEVQQLAELLIAAGCIPAAAEADALHIAVAASHHVDFLLTWNCRHIDNAVRKPLVRATCAKAGYICPEICTPMELFTDNHAS
jgi:predicted nucleic acid-binding protein